MGGRTQTAREDDPHASVITAGFLDHMTILKNRLSGPALRSSFSIKPYHAFAIILVFLGLSTVRSIKEPSNWIDTHWAFTYEHGFIKRGLVGEFISLLIGPVTTSIVNTISLAVLLLLAAALTCLFIMPAIRAPERVGVWLFGVIAVTHSATMPRFAYDLGRFDQMGLLILLVCLLLLVRASPAVRLAVIPPLCLLGLVIHEAFFLMFLPLIAAIWFYEEQSGLIWPKLMVLAAMVASTWVIGRFGLLSNPPLDEYVALLQQRHAFPISKWSVGVLYSDLAKNIALSVSYLREHLHKVILEHLILGATLIPTFLLLRSLGLTMVTGDLRQGGRCSFLLIAAALAPLIMYPLALDYFRWWSAAITNLLMVFAYLAAREDTMRRRLADTIENMPVVSVCIIGVSLVFGPMGENGAYPLFEGIWSIQQTIFP
jgi:hypothetical protein